LGHQPLHDLRAVPPVQHQHPCDVGRAEAKHRVCNGQSILDRGSKTDVGALMLEFGGGGHNAAGTCQVDNDKAEDSLRTLIKRINADG
jgi:nanoRNase/pAp phosphatase (c-di-AMP/oligoRNAs hydrolase)